jgi:hypothetical protein
LVKAFILYAINEIKIRNNIDHRTMVTVSFPKTVLKIQSGETTNKSEIKTLVKETTQIIIVLIFLASSLCLVDFFCQYLAGASNCSFFL